MGYFANLGRAVLGSFAAKASAVGPMIARLWLGHPVWSRRDYKALAEEGYEQNPVVYACISLIAKSVADIPWCLYEGKGDDKTEIDDHPVLDLLKRPNPEQDFRAFLQSIVSYRLIAGNAFIERTDEKKLERMELYSHRPDRMRIIPGPTGTPRGYEYTVDGNKRVFDVDLDSGKKRPILHMKTFNPINDWYGQSPLNSCAWAIDLHTAAYGWNKALLDNSGAPSGAFVYKGDDKSGNMLSDENYERLRKEVKDMRSQSRRGEPLVLEGGLEWMQFGFNPEQMQQHEAVHQAARTIAFTLSVPPELVGIPGDKTYSNYAEARLSFYQECVIPLAREVVSALNHWFEDQLGDAYLDINTDNVDALQLARDAQWARLEKSTMLSLNEKREAIGYDQVENGDEHYVSAGQLPLSMGPVDVVETGKEEEAPAGKPNGKKPKAKPKKSDDADGDDAADEWLRMVH